MREAVFGVSAPPPLQAWVRGELHRRELCGEELRRHGSHQKAGPANRYQLERPDLIRGVAKPELKHRDSPDADIYEDAENWAGFAIDTNFYWASAGMAARWVGNAIMADVAIQGLILEAIAMGTTDLIPIFIPAPTCSTMPSLPRCSNYVTA